MLLAGLHVQGCPLPACFANRILLTFESLLCNLLNVARWTNGFASSIRDFQSICTASRPEGFRLCGDSHKGLVTITEFCEICMLTIKQVIASLSASAPVDAATRCGWHGRKGSVKTGCAGSGRSTCSSFARVLSECCTYTACVRENLALQPRSSFSEMPPIHRKSRRRLLPS